MRRYIRTLVTLGLTLAVTATTGRSEWRMYIHKGATVESRYVADVDSVTFSDDNTNLIPAGTFTMGSPPGEPGRYIDETQHQVTLTRSICVSKYEITQAEWQTVMGWNDSSFSGPNKPVEQVTWYDCISYCNKRSAAEGLDSVYVMTGRSYVDVHITSSTPVTCDWEKSGYRLPTEAEWEYACRATSTTAFCNGGITYPYDCSPLDPNLDLVGWYCGNAGTTTHDVGGKAANAWGLVDMHGNVFEWCWDIWDGEDYPSGPAQDPVGPSSGIRRVIRGGYYGDDAKTCRSADRSNEIPGYRRENIGLRLTRTAQ